MHLLYTTARSDRGHLEPQRVAREDRTAKSAIVQAAKERDLVLKILKFPQAEYRTCLSKSFDLQYARHDRSPWEMSLKKVFVNSYLLNADDPNARLEFDDAVNQQKWVAMRKYLLYSYRIECDHTRNENKKADKTQFRRLIRVEVRRYGFGTEVIVVTGLVL